MNGKWFFKNRNRTIYGFIAINIISFALFMDFFDPDIEALPWWIDFGIPALLNFLYFAVGAYWIFRKVIINEDGIEIVSFKKQIYYFQWNQIVSIEMSNKNRNPSLEITSISNKKIYLDRRKKIIKAIVDYSKEFDNLRFFLNK